MTWPASFDPFLILGVALILASVLLMIRRAPVSDAADVTPQQGDAVLLFLGQELVDASSGARALFYLKGDNEGDLDRCVSELGRRFAGLKQALDDAAANASICLRSAQGDGSMLEIDRWEDYVRLTLRCHPGTGTAVDHLELEMLRSQNRHLRGIAEDAPHLIWIEDDSGEITWANGCYLTLSEKLQASGGSDVPGWPPPALFESAEDDRQCSVSRRQRARVENGGTPQWFTISRQPRDGGTLYFAEDATALVAAEEARRTFVQTLAKTFAHLPTGLAIFDRSRRLVLFNPALHELTGLPVQFLAAQPSFQSVLDQLRDRKMLPETPNYTDWRNQLLDMEAAAKQGTYCETWNLINGQSFRITGRPHPDGALAFLIEDISADLSLTRRFRSEIELGQAVIDSLEPAVAVFTGGGILTMTNRAFTALWDLDADHQVAEITVQDATLRWAELCHPAPLWGDLREFALTSKDRMAWSETVHLKDGRLLSVRIAPLAGGGTICTFETLRDRQQEQPFTSSRLPPDADDNSDRVAIG